MEQVGGPQPSLRAQNRGIQRRRIIEARIAALVKPWIREVAR